MTRARTTWRWRLTAGCMLLLGLAMTQSPGLLVADTKLDLAIAPLDFLARAAHLWDGEGAFGQLQNQAYGYLWPMGPFFAVGSLLDVPGWVVQRLWTALVLCVAFVGAARVARALGVRSDLACLLGGVAYALSPRMLTVIGPSSIEVWPMALAPWVLLPLVVGAERGSPRRAAALSALAIAMVGGVNAAATSAVLPLGVLWLLTRTPGARRRTMMLWWPVFTLLGTLWWLVPLFLLGGYSPPFLDYIESSANTTFPTTLFDSLRGTSNWVPYVDSASRAGNDLLRQTHLVLNSAVVMLLGLAGLALKRNPHRGFLLSGVLVGLFLVTMGHLGPVQGWFAPALQDLLDGVLAPLRNVHKFDPVIRLPMVIGLTFVVDELVERSRVVRSTTPGVLSERVGLRPLVAICVLAVLGAALPAALGRITPAGGFADVPGYWAQAAKWLAEEQDEGTALLVPGSSFGTYVWGSPRDEPFQSLASKPWAVRNAVPLAPSGNIRMLDAVEARLAQGRGGAGLARLLTRSGVSHVVVRNDLTRSADVPDPVLVHQALDASPGLERVESFGPDIGGAPRIEGELGKAMVNGGWQDEYPAIEVYAVSSSSSRVSTTDRPTVVVGGPEDLGDLAEVGLLGAAPALLAADEPDLDPSWPVILTDGLRAVERNFGRLHDSTSQTRSVDQARKLPSRSPDYEVGDAARWSTWAELDGAQDVTASSSQSDANAQGVVEPGMMPFAAIDDDPASAWVSGPGSVLGHWWQLDLGSPRYLGRTSITIGAAQGREVLQVRTDGWTSPLLTFEPGDTRTITVPGRTRVLRIEDQSGRPDNRLAVADVRIAGLSIDRTLVIPEPPPGSSPPVAVVMRRVRDGRSGCARVAGAVRCRAGQATPDEEPRGFERRFTLPQPMTTNAEITVAAEPGQDWDAYLFDDQLVSALASSSLAPDPRSRGVAAIDGTPSTTWIAGVDDTRPELRVAWLGKRAITGLTLGVEPGTAARAPEVLQLTWPGGTRTVRIGERGRVQFAPIRTSRLSIRVLEAEPATDIAFSGSASAVPVGISELRLRGLPLVPVLLPDTERTTPCGAGPRMRINARTYDTRVTSIPADLYDGGSGRAELCGAGEVDLRAGNNEVEVKAGGGFVVDSVVLGDAPPLAGVENVTSTMDSPVRLRADAPGPGQHLVTGMNVNPGWTAAAGGETLEPAVYDGWRQGWRLNGDGAVVEAGFSPDRAYRAALVIGALALLLLLVVALRRDRGRQDEIPALGSRRVPAMLVGVLALAAGGVLAGTTGLGVAAAATVAGVLVNRRAPVTGPTWLVGALLIPAAAAYLARPWGDGAGWAGSWAWPHYLVLAGCCSVLGVLAADSSRRHRSDTRVAGTSIAR
ncbi:coagulation factor 5/8 type [Planomonospora venezuelensis]|nr:coagulation factor 5/8 type [Planomonospora venezuelensis]